MHAANIPLQVRLPEEAWLGIVVFA